MEVRLRAAARALAAFDPLEALQHVALHDDPPALALRGIAMAQLGDLPRARKLLQRAARGFGSAQPLERARCVAAKAEVALAARDLGAAERGLKEAACALERHGDRENARFARLQLVQHMILVGRLDEASTELSSLEAEASSARISAIASLLEMDVAVRRVQPLAARRALERAREAAASASIPLLAAEVERAAASFEAPVARHRVDGIERPVTVGDVDALIRSGELVVDACRTLVQAGGTLVVLTGRPVLFALAVVLGEAAAEGATRENARPTGVLGSRPQRFASRAPARRDQSPASRALGPCGGALDTRRVLAPTPRRRPCPVLLPPGPGDTSAVVAVLAAGEAWSTSALAAAVGASQRTVQRELAELLSAGRVHAQGRGRSRRWVADSQGGFATALLLSRVVIPCVHR